MTDYELVERVKNGETGAFEELVLRHQKAMYYFVLRLLKNSQEAEDTVQKIFLLAYQNIKGFRADASFKTWIYKIGINQCHNFFRSQKNREYLQVEEVPVADYKADPEGEFSAKERVARLQEAVEHLPYKQRMVVTLRIHQELSFEEIGKTLGIRTNSAKVNFHHALEKLKTMVKTEKP
ncbi:MAG: RNA polymerase sigma factor [Thermodesulfobacteriota bacterium]